MNYLEELPKIELHLHLDGSLDLNYAHKILNKDIIDITNNMIAKEKCLDLNEYLTKFAYPEEILQTKESLQESAYKLAKNLQKENVIYAEIRFAPLKHIKKNLTLDDVVTSVLEGLKKVNIKTNLILCMMRGMSFEDNKKVILLSQKYLNRGVVGLDLAGAESLYKTKDYKELFNLANKLNIPFTIHAGEADGKDSIKSAISFGAKRLGHGIRIYEDQNLLKEVKEKQILLEICPTSNIQTNVVKDYSNHPIKKYYEENILVSINTDNRTVSNTNLTLEYAHLINDLDFTLKDIIKMNEYSCLNSFLPNIEKENLLKEYQKQLERFFKKIS